MTDNEIIKASACCSSKGKMDCKNCPLKNSVSCVTEMIDNALDLINRQKAEIERLQKENNRFADIGKMYGEIKAEAVKDFINQ